jgi:transcriptional regulator with XRE-family HTH domain
MARKTTIPLPSVQRALKALGENIRLARRRRKLTATLLAERAGMTRPTLRAIERGDPGVTIGAYANALHSLGLASDLAGVARDDALGRKLQDSALARSRRSAREDSR